MYKSTAAYVTGAIIYSLFTTPSINSGTYTSVMHRNLHDRRVSELS